MGMGLCCKTNSDDKSNEMKDGIIPTIENRVEDNRDLKISSYIFNSNYYKLESLDSEVINTDQQLSEEIFNIYNKIRNNPSKYITEAKKYEVYQIISSAIERVSDNGVKNLIKNPFFDLFFDKCVKASINSKEDILKNIEKEKLFKDYEKNLYIIEAYKEKIEECVWNLLKNCLNEGEDILAKDIDYLVVSSLTLEDKNKFLCFYLFLSKIQEKSIFD